MPLFKGPTTAPSGCEKSARPGDLSRRQQILGTGKWKTDERVENSSGKLVAQKPVQESSRDEPLPYA